MMCACQAICCGHSSVALQCSSCLFHMLSCAQRRLVCHSVNPWIATVSLADLQELGLSDDAVASVKRVDSPTKRLARLAGAMRR